MSMKLHIHVSLLLRLFREHYIKENNAIITQIIDIILKKEGSAVVNNFHALQKLVQENPIDRDAIFMLGYCYSEGLGVEKNIEEAYRYYKKAHDLGLMLGTTLVGYSYIYGSGVKKDVCAGLKLYNIAVQKRTELAQVMLAFEYNNGNTIPNNPKEYLRLIQEVVEGGSLTMYYLLAQLYREGIEGYVEQDTNQAMALARIAAERGDAMAQFLLACWLFEEKNTEDGLSWMWKSAKQDCGAAWYLLGHFSQMGRGGVAPDVSQAIAYYQRAADTGDRRGLLELKNCYEKDPKNTKEAMETIVESFLNQVPDFRIILQSDVNVHLPASVSQPHARYNLAFCLYHRLASERYPELGLITKRNQEIDTLNAAVKLIQSAAKEGSEMAQFHLGYLYEKGIGVPRSPALMCANYKIARDNDFGDKEGNIDEDDPDNIIHQKLCNGTEIFEPLKDTLTNFFAIYKREISIPEITSIISEYAYDKHVRLFAASNKLRNCLFMFSAFSCKNEMEMARNKELTQEKTSSTIAGYAFEVENDVNDENEHPFVKGVSC